MRKELEKLQKALDSGKKGKGKKGKKGKKGASSTPTNFAWVFYPRGSSMAILNGVF